MIFVLGCPLPDLDDKKLEELCVFWEKALAGSLDEIQLQHIKNFARTGAPLKARASRILARLAALSLMPKGARIFADRNGGHFGSASGIRLCFSHSGFAAFCALGHFERPAIRLGLDAESAYVIRQGNFQNSRKLKNWLKMEACLKAFGVDGTGSNFSLDGNFYSPRYARVKYLAAPGHILCLVSNAANLAGIYFRWLHHSKLI